MHKQCAAIFVYDVIILYPPLRMTHR